MVLTESRIRDIEELIRYRQKSERALYIDKNGKIVYDSLKSHDEKGKKRIVPDEIKDLEFADKGVIAIHSHPVFFYAKSFMGSSFSPDDLYKCMADNFSEIRMCDRYYTFILKRKGTKWVNYWGKYWNKDVKKKIEAEMKQIWKAYREKVTKGNMKLSVYLRDFQHQVVKEFAKKYGLIYKRELRHPLPPIPDFTKTLPKKDKKEFPNMRLE